MTPSPPGSTLRFIPCPLAGLILVERGRVEDHRGVFSRVYSADEFAVAGLPWPVVQINYSLTRRAGTVRGMHFQWPPHAEKKLVSCVRGEILDVAVDLRKHSRTFLCWHSEVLSSVNARSLFIPEGFAHGFQALSPDCELVYLHSAAYDPSAEGALNVLDPKLSITWPLDIVELSARDRHHPMLAADFDGVTL